MTKVLPDPGMGYKVREYLGGGYWKSAYRATSSFNLSDVALLYFNDDSQTDVIGKDVTNLLISAAKHKYSGYLAKFHGFHRGRDGRFFIIEELLARPLDVLAPLNELLQFTRIARDLCRALVCLHETKLVHRDLKLDNCGLDHQHRAKIFDLGSLTSEGGSLDGTILTRAPELFLQKEGKCSFATDVWALGATLFALRTGEYPFVQKNEILRRRNINDAARNNAITMEQGKQQKQEIDAVIASRILGKRASDELNVRIRATMRGRGEELLSQMLNFDDASRRNICYFDEHWNQLALELAGSSAQMPNTLTRWEMIKRHLQMVVARELVLTPMQVERIISDYEVERATNPDPELERLLQDVKSIA